MLHRKDVLRAIDTVQSGGVICYPTEGVFGLGCLPLAHDAVDRILQFKRRPVGQGLILIGADLNQLLPWISPSATELKHLQSHTDRPTTWVVTSSDATPDWVTGGRSTVAVRICRHPIARELCTASDSALVSTSANRSGRPAVTSSVRARYLLRNTADTVVSGETNPNIGASAIRIAASNAVIRGA